jgi:hypothetical protein
MKFNELAWAAFVWSNLNGTNTAYEKTVRDEELLKRLQENPSIKEFDRVRDYLVHFGVHVARKDYGEQLLSLWPILKPHVKALMGEKLETCNLNSPEMSTKISSAYDCLYYGAWGADTVVSKVLHLFNVSLLPMWDFEISVKYTPKVGSSGYLEFLKTMKQHAIEAIEDFHKRRLPESPTEFLSQRLGYAFTRPLTKFLDDYNWVTITRKWPPNIPDWLSDLLCQTELS